MCLNASCYTMGSMKIDEIPFAVSVLLGEADIPLSAYLELQIGDVIVLNQKSEESLRVRIGSVEHYVATAGLFETHKAITIDGRVHTR